MESTNRRNWYESDLFHLAVITGAALAIGVYLIATCVLVNPDGVFYIERAHELVEAPWRTIRTFPPGYPALLLASHKIASLFGLGDSSMAWIYSSQAVTLLCRILALVCLYFVGKLLVGARRSFWGVLLLTFLPYPADFGSDTLREWPYLLGVIGAIWLLWWSLRTGRWWGYGLVGLVTGLSFLIRPESAQVLVYALLGLVVGIKRGAIGRPAALAALTVGFLVAASPYLGARGTVVPHQLTETLPNRVPVITSVAGRSTGADPLEFDVDLGQWLELPVEASDPDGDELTLSAVAIPAGARPVYRFEAVTANNCYLTLSESEKATLIVDRVPHTYTYEGIEFYAWPDGNGPPGLKPVYGFWLPGLAWHIFTLDESERGTLQAQVQADQGIGDYIAFYAFAGDDRPADAVGVYRYQDSTGAPHWTIDVPAGAASRHGEPAWYAFAPAKPPAGFTLENGIARWRPRAGQEGIYTLNLIASDGQFQTCQLLRIKVAASPEAAAAEAPPSEQTAASRPASPSAGPSESLALEADQRKAGLWEAIYETGGAFSENIMHLLLIPMTLGLYRFLKDEAGPWERALTAAIMVVNLGMMVARYMVVEPGPHRRYCQVLVAFSLLHVPAGMQILAHWSHAATDKLRRGRVGGPSEQAWFCVLVGLALGPLCLPKMISPMNIEKRGHRQVIDWLRANTRPEDIVAAPDIRIGFYAERRGPFYEGTPDPRSCDYVVTITPRDIPESAPIDWKKLYSPPLAPNAPERVTVYKVAPEGG